MRGRQAKMRDYEENKGRKRGVEGGEVRGNEESKKASEEEGYQDGGVQRE
jgi:hypothetical protein